ncbi:Ubiquitin carboxyl-terminal hydrolase MINDY-1, partial [Taenia solium]
MLTCPKSVYFHRAPSGHVYVLVTDVGFVSEPNFVWETLNNIDGDSQFVDGEFRVCTKPTSSTAAVAAAPASNAAAVVPASVTSPSAFSALPITTTAMSTPSEQNDLDHKLAVERADLELAKRLQAEENAAYLKQASDSASQSSSCSPSHRRQNGGGYDPTKSSSWQETAQARSDLELARRLQAAENEAYYSQTPGSPHRRPHHSPSHSSQHRHRHQQEQSPSSWSGFTSRVVPTAKSRRRSNAESARICLANFWRLLGVQIAAFPELPVLTHPIARSKEIACSRLLSSRVSEQIAHDAHTVLIFA